MSVVCSCLLCAVSIGRDLNYFDCVVSGPSGTEEVWVEAGCSTQLWTVAAAVHFARWAHQSGAVIEPPLWSGRPRALTAPTTVVPTANSTAHAPPPLQDSAFDLSDTRPVCERYPQLKHGVPTNRLSAYCPDNPTHLKVERFVTRLTFSFLAALTFCCFERMRMCFALCCAGL